MLSNFQYGNQALLQTFLVGQPEFREILQRPEMEQFRQRVAATCHIGPLDAEETKAYIEHRLKCAGSAGRPTFEPEAFNAIYKASHGIPRRINTICDRLLLLGFLCERTHLTVTDVDEVVREFANESVVPGKPVIAADYGEGKNGHAALADEGAPVDLSGLSLDPGLAKGIHRQIDALGADQFMDQLQRLERSVLRLERMNVQTLSMLKKLVNAVKKSSGEAAK
jgi:general secretion pathway protein A